MQRFCLPTGLGKVRHSTQSQKKDLVQDQRYRPNCERMMNTIRGKKTDTILRWICVDLAAVFFFLGKIVIVWDLFSLGR